MATCPQCGLALIPVKRESGSMLNDDQFDAVRAGDWYCEKCPPNGRSHTPRCYWWNRELAASPKETP